MKKLPSANNRDGFFASFSILTGATLIGQLIGIASLVLIGRTFDLNAVGKYQVFLAYSATLGTISLFGYQVAIPHIKENTLSLVLKPLLILLPSWAITVALASRFFGYEYSIWLGILVTGSGLSSLAQMLNLRNQSLRLLAIVQCTSPLMFLTCVLVLLKVANSELHAGDLIKSHTLIASGVAVVYFWLSFRRELLKRHNWKEHVVELYKRRGNALYVMPSALINSLSYNLPTLLLGYFFGAGWAASYAIALKFCFGPISLISENIGKVFHSQMSYQIRENRNGGRTLFISLTKSLFIVGLTLGLGIYFLYEPIITSLMGDQWLDSARIAKILSPLFASMLLVSSLSVTLFIFEKYFAVLISQIGYVIISAASFGLGAFYEDAWLAIWTFSAAATLRYCLLYFYLYFVCGKNTAMEQPTVS